MTVYACLPTDDTEIEVVGTIVPAVYKSEELVAHYKAIKLKEDLCFMPDNVISEEQVVISEVQLSVPNNLQVEVGSSYRLRGIAIHAHTAHHFTKIFIEVKNAKKL